MSLLEFGIQFPGLESLGAKTVIGLELDETYPHTSSSYAQRLRDQVEGPKSTKVRHHKRGFSRAGGGNPRSGRKGNGYRR